MSKYTTELRFYCETLAGFSASAGQLNISQIISAARPQIFNFDYPIFDPAHKEELETKILLHYYLREIAFETVGVWKLYLQSTMLEIMPYYNQLYETAALKIDPLTNFKSTETAKRDVTSNATATGSSNQDSDSSASSTNQDAYSDTPQGSLSGVKTLNYLTNARIVDDDSNSTTSTTARSNSDTTAASSEANNVNITGYRGISSSQLVKEYRDNILNIDQMIIDDLASLFFNLY